MPLRNRRQVTAPADDTHPGKPEALWSSRATGGGRGRALGVRWTVAVVLVLVAAALIARGLQPVNRTTIYQTGSGGVSPIGTYASGFARDWFTWDADNRADRSARLSVYNPDLRSSSWNGTGTQHVTSAAAFSQEDLGDSRYRVTVRLTVDTTETAFYVDVLVIAHDGAYAVGSVPTLVPAPLLADGAIQPAATQPEPDTTVTKAISSQLALFFAAWASGDATLGQFIASGSTIAPLGGGVSLKAMGTVTVPALPSGSDTSTRTVTASLEWNWPGGATAPATYSVDVRQEAGKWFVTAVRGAVADSGIAPSRQSASQRTPTTQPSPTSTSTAPSTHGPTSSPVPTAPTDAGGD